MYTLKTKQESMQSQHHNLDHKTTHSLAASLTSPTFNLGVYFFNTFSLWYCIITVSPSCPSHPPPIASQSVSRGRQYLPKLLRRILARNTLKNLRTTGMLVDEIRDVVDVAVDDDVQALVGGLVRGDVGGGEGLGHFQSIFPFRYSDCVDEFEDV